MCAYCLLMYSNVDANEEIYVKSSSNLEHKFNIFVSSPFCKQIRMKYVR